MLKMVRAFGQPVQHLSQNHATILLPRPLIKACELTGKNGSEKEKNMLCIHSGEIFSDFLEPSRFFRFPGSAYQFAGLILA